MKVLTDTDFSACIFLLKMSGKILFFGNFCNIATETKKHSWLVLINFLSARQSFFNQSSLFFLLLNPDNYLGYLSFFITFYVRHFAVKRHAGARVAGHSRAAQHSQR